MNIGLYVNVMLIGEPAIKVAGLAPLYPRRSQCLDARAKAEVLKLSLSSISELPVSKIILNIETSSDFGFARADIMAHARTCFPQAEIVHESKRPTTLDAWKESTCFAESVFGPTMPVLCFFNHDHIFVDFRPEPFLRFIEAVYSNPANQNAFLAYSHAPEAISLVYDVQAYLSRLRYVPGGSYDFSPALAFGDSMFKIVSINCMDSLFMTTVSGLREMWSRVVATVDYMPRPDWYSVVFKDAYFEIFVSTREFFRHFDGYGHVSFLRGGLALDLMSFGRGAVRAKHHVPQIFGGSRTGAATATLEQEADSYAEIFFDNFSVASRDALFAQFCGSGRKSGRAVIEDLVTFFLKAYLENPGELDHRTEEQKRDLSILVVHRIFSSANAFQQELIADCSLWYPVFTVPPLGEQLRMSAKTWLKTILPRFLPRFWRWLFR